MKKHIFALLIATFFIFFPSSVHAIEPYITSDTERITNFHSDIAVQENGKVIVTESISVYARGIIFKRGIYKDFPLIYKNDNNQKHRVTFKVRGVLRDGEPENYFFENIPNGKRLYIGEEDEYLTVPQEYTYTITYESDRQIRFFENYDELYWNVAGEWNVPIENLSTTVTLPAKIPKESIQFSAYTGSSGEKGQDVESRMLDDQTVSFVTTKKIPMLSDLTISVSWPKGIVAEPTQAKLWWYRFRDNLSTIMLILGMIAVPAFYFISWYHVGRDPKKDTLVPQYEPPKDISPAAARYILKMGYDHKTLSAALIHLFVLKRVKLIETKKFLTKKISLQKIKNDEGSIASEEEIIVEKFFTNDQPFELGPKNATTIRTTEQAVEKSLKDQCEKVYFHSNLPIFSVGLIASLLFLTGPILASYTRNQIVPMIATSGFFSLFLTSVIVSSRKIGRGAHGLLEKMASSIILLIVGALFIGTTLFFLYSEQEKSLSLEDILTTLAPIISATVIVATNVLFHHLLKKPTLEGRKIMDHLDGFKWYLSVAEKDRMNFHTPLKKTPELFEKYLPYAVALDVEHAWAENFSDVLYRVKDPKSSYHPVWYSGTSFDTSRVSSFVSSISSSVSSSVSTGASGGGSAGGGGGSGGGGGW